MVVLVAREEEFLMKCQKRGGLSFDIFVLTPQCKFNIRKQKCNLCQVTVQQSHSMS